MVRCYTVLTSMQSSHLLNIPLFFGWLLVVCLSRISVEAVQGCSVFFQPDFKWKKAICDSEQSRLDRIPADLPNNLVELHVIHQFITVLGAEGLRDLIHLQTLAIESSGLGRIMPDAFHTLANLTQLSLRNNSLQLGYNGLPAEVFRNLPRLQMLNLAENPIDVIPDLFFASSTGGPSPLQRLWLGSVKSTSMLVERQGLAGLTQLRLLDLSQSKLVTLPVSLAGQFDSMTELRELYLGGNPWHCDCQLRWLRMWFLRRQSTSGLVYLQHHVNRYGRQVTSEPVCFSPEPLRDRKLFGVDDLEAADFSEFYCAPKLLTNHQNITIMAGKPTKLTCEFYADPKASVSWFKDSILIKNDSQYSVVNQFVEETLISDLHAKFTRVGERLSLTCKLDDQPGEMSATYHVTVIPYDAALDDDRTGPAASVEFAGLSVTHQSWIYAGVGAGVLFILLTSIGVGIFYCCDPRSHADQTFQRIVSKDQVNRLRSCYGCQKLATADSSKHNGDDSFEKGGTEGTRVRTNDSSQAAGEDDEAERVELCPQSASRNHSPLSQAIPKPAVIVAPAKSQLGSPTLPTQLGGSLIRETVSTGENRLLVSCDGPEPTVILATRLSGYNELSSPSSVYGMFDPNKLSPSIKVSLPVSMSSYICSPSFSGLKNAPNFVDKAHIYASLSPVANLHGINKNPQLISIPKSRYTTPCPVHGSIQLDRVGLTQSVIVPTKGMDSDRETNEAAERFTGNATPNKHNAISSNLGSDLPENSEFGTVRENWYRSKDESSGYQDNGAEGEEEEEEEEDEEDDEEDEEGHEVDDDDDDSGLIPHSMNLNPKTEIPFRTSQAIDPRRFKPRGAATLHRPKSFTVLNSRGLGKPRLVMPQSGSVHNMHPYSTVKVVGRRELRGYPYASADPTFADAGAKSTRRGIGSHPRAIARASPRVAPSRPGVAGPYKPCIRTSFSDELHQVADVPTVPAGSNPETSDETWNSNSDSETPTEETSSPTHAMEVQSNTEDHDPHGFRRRSILNRRGSSCTLNFPSSSWSTHAHTGHMFPRTTGRGVHPAKDVYQVATLPSRFRKSRSPGNASSAGLSTGGGGGVPLSGQIRTRMPSGSYRDFATIRRHSSSQRSQTLVRPGSKHKLDTDSGTDNND